MRNDRLMAHIEGMIALYYLMLGPQVNNDLNTMEQRCIDSIKSNKHATLPFKMLTFDQALKELEDSVDGTK